MSEYTGPLQDMAFLIEDVFALPDQWSTYSALDASLDMPMVNSILAEAEKLCAHELVGLNQLADQSGLTFDDGKVQVPEGFKKAYALLCEGGWTCLGGDPAFGGMGMPKALVAQVEEMLQGSCMALGLAPMLTAGACLAIHSHASDTLKDTYLPKLYSGEWSGAMDLTEPQAGTDLGLISTRAKSLEDGSYQLTGTKIFITWGEHDLTDNIVHLVLARAEGAPEGVRGISMFLVPKLLLDSAGQPTIANNLTCGGLEHKMGIHASPTCVMNFDGAKGWLVGELNRGLAAMFTMMNYERLVVGIQALGVAERSYQIARKYARERLQGHASNAKDETSAIIEHADVRRMLMTMRVNVEGGRALSTYVSQWLDAVKFGSESDTKAQDMMALLTPVAKAFLTDQAMETCLLGQQVLGGAGYMREWEQEQHVRDVRITQIYEGTNGVQAMDLLARKVVGSEGRLIMPLVEDVRGFVEALDLSDELQALAASMSEALQVWQSTTDQLLEQAQTDSDSVGAAAGGFLTMTGLVVSAYLWLRMAAAAQAKSPSAPFCQDKIACARYFYDRHLPCIYGLQRAILAGSESVMAIPAERC